MTPEQFVAALKLVFGEVGWGRQAAVALGIHAATVSQYANGQVIPGPVCAAVWGFVQLYKMTGERPRPVSELEWVKA